MTPVPPTNGDRLSMPLGEAIFTQRSIRRFRPDPLPMDDIQLAIEAAMRAPNGGNLQLARFLIVDQAEIIRDFGRIYFEAWWAKRRDEGYERAEDLPSRYLSAARLANDIGDVPCIVFALGIRNAPANSVIPAVQNFMLAARALGIGSVPTTLHPSVMPRFHALFAIPEDVSFHFCIPVGYPRGNFGPNDRKPTAETTFLNSWGRSVPWQ
jgi:nitroreductase